jgi:hypothetical protein
MATSGNLLFSLTAGDLVSQEVITVPVGMPLRQPGKA